MSKVDYLINYLLSERNDLGNIAISENEQDKFRLYRSLVNIRPAVKADDNFLQIHEGQHILLLELGVGYNTPVIIKYPFWKMTYANPKAVYACLNFGEVYAPNEIEGQSICINGDIHSILESV